MAFLLGKTLICRVYAVAGRMSTLPLAARSRHGSEGLPGLLELEARLGFII
jgi:hypothetical protein